MITSQLIINKMGTYDVIVTATLTSDKKGKLEHYEVISVHNYSLEDAAEFLIKQGVEPSEINYALEQLEEHGHTLADFGMFCSLISTDFTGTLQ